MNTTSRGITVSGEVINFGNLVTATSIIGKSVSVTAKIPGHCKEPEAVIRGLQQAGESGREAARSLKKILKG